MKFFLSYINQKKAGIIIFILTASIFAVSYSLYHLPLGAVLYPMAVSAFFGTVILVADYKRAHKKHLELIRIQQLSIELMDYFPKAATIEDKDYQKIIGLIKEEQAMRTTQINVRLSNMTDYYTAWVHQIKTPIASMSLKLQNDDSDFSNDLTEDLIKIEQYVEMVLMFLRLESDYTDYIIKEYELDQIVKACVKKFSKQFIRRKIRLDYRLQEETVLTDEKWLSFVIEQVLSNALKYTDSGTISIYLKKSKTLCIEDTGIGIAPEDLPRIFDRGFTGYNGRTDKKASGIGLHLCRMICKNLNHTISASSVQGKGTVIEIGLDRSDLEIE